MKIKKKNIIITSIIIIIIVIFVIGGIVLLLMKNALVYHLEGDGKGDKNSDMSIKFKGNYISDDELEEKLSEDDYYEHVEEAMKNADLKKDEEKKYQQKMDEIIKTFENENYILVYFRSIKNEERECFTLAKFKKKNVGTNIKYAFLRSSPLVVRKDALYVGNIEKDIENQLLASDFAQGLNIDPENTRFVYGSNRSDIIYSLEIEGQKPTEIIEYEVFGDKRYFWYYENLESDKPSSSLEFTLDEE